METRCYYKLIYFNFSLTFELKHITNCLYCVFISCFPPYMSVLCPSLLVSDWVGLNYFWLLFQKLTILPGQFLWITCFIFSSLFLVQECLLLCPALYSESHSSPALHLKPLLSPAFCLFTSFLIPCHYSLLVCILGPAFSLCLTVMDLLPLMCTAKSPIIVWIYPSSCSGGNQVG